MAKKNTGRKPRPKKTSFIDYHEAQSWISKKLGYSIRDAAGSFPHYDEWCRKHGERPDGSSQEQYRRYKKAADGERARPPYYDYWHFLVDRLSPPRGGTIMIGSGLMEACEPWQEEITKAFMSEFGDNRKYWTDW